MMVLSSSVMSHLCYSYQLGVALRWLRIHTLEKNRPQVKIKRVCQERGREGRLAAAKYAWHKCYRIYT